MKYSGRSKVKCVRKILLMTIKMWSFVDFNGRIVCWVSYLQYPFKEKNMLQATTNQIRKFTILSILHFYRHFLSNIVILESEIKIKDSIK